MGAGCVNESGTAENLMITRSLSLDLAGDKDLLFFLEISAGTWKSGF